MSNPPILSQAGQEFIALAREGTKWVPLIGIYTLLVWIINTMPTSEVCVPAVEQPASVVEAESPKGENTLHSIVSGVKALIH